MHVKIKSQINPQIQSNPRLPTEFLNMTDAAEARREARRKRILENSHNRLQLISGKCSNEDFSVASKETTNVSPIPHNYEDTFASIPSDSSVSSYSIPNGGVGLPDSFEPLLSRHDVASGDGEMGPAIANLIAASTPATPENVEIPLWKYLIKYKYDIVFLSLFMQFLHCLSAFPHEDFYFFAPLIIYSITKYFYLPRQNDSNIANILMLLNGMSSNGIHKMLNALQWVGTFSQDACIFLFTTICLEGLYNFVIEKFIT